MLKTLKERFDEKWMPVPFSGCWIWLAYVWPNTGYGCFSLTHRKSQHAHIVAYQVYRGDIPVGLQLDHLCRVRCCVNPWHLEAVTCQINLLRGNTFNARNAAVTQCPKGHHYEGDNLYLRATGARGCNICRREACRTYRSKRQQSNRKEKGDLWQTNNSQTLVTQG